MPSMSLPEGVLLAAASSSPLFFEKYSAACKCCAVKLLLTFTLAFALTAKWIAREGVRVVGKIKSCIYSVGSGHWKSRRETMLRNLPDRQGVLGRCRPF